MVPEPTCDEPSRGGGRCLLSGLVFEATSAPVRLFGLPQTALSERQLSGRSSRRSDLIRIPMRNQPHIRLRLGRDG